MIFPNIQIITKDQNVYFADYFNRSIKRDACRYEYLKPYYNLDSKSAIVILSQICKNYKESINFIKNNNISNIYFFIDDIFRSSLQNSFYKLSEPFEEIQKIKLIIKKTKIKNYKIHHCEFVKEKIDNLEVNYADLYLNDYIIRNKNYKLFQNQKLFYKISCLNNRKDIHRQIIGLLICNKKDVFLTINDHLPLEYLINNNLFDLKNLDSTIFNLLHSNITYLDNNIQNYLDPLNKNQTLLKNNIQNNNFAYNIIQNSFLNIVTETCYTSNYINISEKTIKPIVCKRPFLMLGTPGCLQHLRNLGFKTFDKWWDESYDLELDNAKRLQKVYYIAKNILNKSFEELKTILNDMNDVLEFNRNHLCNIQNKLLSII